MKKIIFLCLFFWNTFVFADSELRFINFPALDMHASPDLNSPVISQAIYNTGVQVLQNKSGFSQIMTPDNYKGWVQKNYLTSRSVFPDAQVAKVKNLFANVFEKPATDIHPPIFTAPFGTEFTILNAEDDRWIKIQLADNSSGWIQRGDVEIDAKPMTLEKMLDFSKKFLGLPYLWGGVSTYGFDCSGFVQMLYKQVGIMLPRDGIDQAYYPGYIDVSPKNLEPGDRMYFGFDGKISHAAVYLGDNKFIGSTVYLTPIVQIADLRLQHWQDMFIVAKHFDDEELPQFQGAISAIPDSLKQKMLQYSWHEGCPVTIDNLAYVKVSYFGFDYEAHTGALIVGRDVAPDVLAIFKELYEEKFPIEKIKPIEEYAGNDVASMADNNTSAFNCRAMTGFANQYSLHSYGRAIDINPLYNPYVNDKEILPEEGAGYVDRKAYHKGKITLDSKTYEDFKERGWIWGGEDWNNKIRDYQHFEKPFPR